MITTMTSRDFNQDCGGAKRAAINGPVVITDRGRPAHVLLTYAAYQDLRGMRGTVIDALGMAAGGSIDFDIPPMGWTPKDVDLS